METVGHYHGIHDLDWLRRYVARPKYDVLGLAGIGGGIPHAELLALFLVTEGNTLRRLKRNPKRYGFSVYHWDNSNFSRSSAGAGFHVGALW